MNRVERARLWLLLAWSAGCCWNVSAAAAPSPAAACAPCHAARVRAQAGSPHALALRPYAGEAATRFAGRTVRERSGRVYAFSADGLSISSGPGTMRAGVAWAFGSGVQAVTPVLERNGRWVEHRISWYRQGDRLSLTPGHEPIPPLEDEDAFGVAQTEANAKRCFGCHMTAGEAGVTCQACHGEAAEHRSAPARKGGVQRDRSVELCATCHRSPDRTYASPTPELEDPRSIRFAPVGLEASRCFQKSPAGRLTCVTCHDPHTQAKPTRAGMTAVCRSCHMKPAVRGAAANCPRSPDCANCHMPASSPIPNLRFTDHRIRR